MKKNGFTLAEVLVAIGIIGVAAALTIPTFVSNGRNQANAAKLSTTISAVENALTSMIASEGVQDLTETDFGSSLSAGDLGRYLKGASSSTSITFSDIAGTAENNDTPGMTFETKSGAILMFTSSSLEQSESDVKSLGGSVTGAVASLVIDVNGSELPNKWGRDAFYFLVGTDGLLYPAGGVNFSILQKKDVANVWSKKDSTYICNDVTKSANCGIGCTARLIENNYKVDF